MKFKKPTEKTGKDTVATAGGVVVGSMVSRALMGFIDKPEEQADIKKAENATLMKRGVLVLAGGITAAFVDGTDTVATVVKAVAIGVAVQQGLEAIKTLSARGGVADASTATTTAKKAIANAVGLGCACDGNGLNGRKRSRGRGGLRYPVIQEYAQSGMDYAPQQAVQPIIAGFATRNILG